jgi:2-oxoglutarate dehydrogenase E1 component
MSSQIPSSVVSPASSSTFLSGANAEYIANLYKEYLHNPAGVDAGWQKFFGDLNDAESSLLREITGASWTPPQNKRPSAPFGITTADEALKATKPSNQSSPAKPAPASPAAPAPVTGGKIDPEAVRQAALDSFRAFMLIRSYRAYGHMKATLDPLGMQPPGTYPELDPAYYGFGPEDMDRRIYIGALLGVEEATIRQIVELMGQMYSANIGVEYLNVLDQSERQWLQERVELNWNRTSFSPDEKKRIFGNLVAAQGLEEFIHTKYVGAKRFGIDGGESYIAALEEIVHCGAGLGVREVIIGMAHRGRLNTLTNFMGKPFVRLFAEFNGEPSVPGTVPGSGDVKYHMGYSGDRMIDGEKVHLSLTPNPSHLEVVNPVVLGKARAKQQRRGAEGRTQVLPLLVHGDAAFAGQGLVAETLMLSEISGYAVGGTVHVIINNQIGFTTNPRCSRSGLYSSDLAKMLNCPIFHVNGDDVEAVVHVSRIATEYRQKYGRDVVIDLVCYRRYGHNEGDEPLFTQPKMYKTIKEHVTVRDLYGRKLIEEGLIREDDLKMAVARFFEKLDGDYDAAKTYKPDRADWLEGDWTGLKPAHGDDRRGETSIGEDTFAVIGSALTSVPEGFALNSKIARQLETKKTMFASGSGFDWATAEALAFASLTREGYPVRLSGQDCGRGTFSQRHAVLRDQETEEDYLPINNVAEGPARFEVLDSPLSEAAVLGFEYGYSWAAPNALTLWEGQFGDFVNGAQVIIDQYIAAAESKWLRMSGLVMLLPHGFEGQGPEHSSARPERFLQLCAEDNMQVCNLTTPANYFHALRRQMKRDFRKPLIIMTPKSLLRHKLAVSGAEDFTGASTFHRVLPDGAAARMDTKAVKRVVLCSGKVYYDLYEEREKRGITNVALVRVEQLYPYPEKPLLAELSQYPKAEIVWCQEEPKNQGYWSFIEPLLEETLDKAGTKSLRARYVGRSAAAAPATGYLRRHTEEQAALVNEALTV